MFLKSLTLRGFKSFADKTHLEFEPGITVVVGPNGSGKSNVVDALSWVLGTHSAKSLRGGSMADVIFAGSPGKPALGRAAVEITIDNADGSLPIEFSEVTVARSMFASGENTYAINGVDCRLLDVVELLSDTGLGRQNHTIVGQGQLDGILNAKPEDRRAFIEEAAGILKHRKRKERALRKIAQTEAHTERLTDLVRELKRNLRPLERQAEAASKHAALAAALHRARAVRAVRESDALTRRLDDDRAAQTSSDAHLAGLERTVADAREAEQRIEAELGGLTPTVRAAGETHFALANLAERYRGLSGRISERSRGLVDAVEEPVAGRDPDRLRADATAERAALVDLERERASARAALEQAEADRREAEQARRAHEQAAAAEARRRAQAREQQLRWEGEVSALRSSLAQAAGEEGRLASQLSGLDARRAELERDVTAVTAEIQRLDRDQVALGEQLAAAEQLVTRRQAAATDAARAERELERRRASLEARADALRASSEEATGGASALLAAAAGGNVDHIIGPLADHVSVIHGRARAVAAALGPMGDAVVVASRDGAHTALAFLAESKGGRALLLPAVDTHGTAEPAARPDRDRALADYGARPLVDALRAEPGVLAALRLALAATYVVEDLAAAARLCGRNPDCSFVTLDGEIAGPRGWAGGSAVASSAVASRAAAEQAETQLEQVSADLVVAHRRLGACDRELEGARRELDAATAAMQESDGLITSAAERLGRLRKELATCAREQETLSGQRHDLDRELAAQRDRLATLEARGPQLAADPDADGDGDGPDLAAERLDDALADAREIEVQARLAASAVEQRGVEVERRIAAFEREAGEVEQQLAEREQRRVARLAAIDRCRALSDVVEAALRRTERSLDEAAAARDRLEERRGEHQRELGVVRARVRELDEQLRGARDARHAAQLRRAELVHAVDAVHARIHDDLDLDPDTLLAAARHPAMPAPAGRDGEPLWTGEVLAGGGDRDAELAEDEERLVRRIGLLGTVNPLALEEFSAVKERHAFITGQLADLHASRDDLLQVVRAVDDRIREVFGAAFDDVAREFARVFPRLFPGGEGRLVLTDPDDLLLTGVDVEARPPGKRVKRLSLLSGGERSLTALAVLFAIFAARPSPFYVLDEVEAALDDVNLQRFLDVVGDFQASSQLVIVTHQKRTMEVADTLYGVSMQGDGVSKVISQRLREAALSGR
ncbi:MAG: chromosome segregation protein SMC [Egibacteraceae bacterium]